MYLSHCHISRSPSPVGKAGEQNFAPKWLYLTHLGFAVLMSLQVSPKHIFRGCGTCWHFPARTVSQTASAGAVNHGSWAVLSILVCIVKQTGRRVFVRVSQSTTQKDDFFTELSSYYSVQNAPAKIRTCWKQSSALMYYKQTTSGFERIIPLTSRS